jgi:hypothetical protein
LLHGAILADRREEKRPAALRRERRAEPQPRTTSARRR